MISRENELIVRCVAQGMFSARNKFIAAAVVAALVSSSAATAATPAPVATAAPAAQSSWMALSMLTPSGAIGLGGAAAAQAASDNPPAPPPPEGYARGGGFPPLPVIAILLADVALAIYIATKHHSGHVVLPTTPNSPA